MRTIITFTVLAGAAALALAQNAPQPKTPRDQSLYISDAKLREIMQKSPASFSSRLISDTTHSTAFIRLDKPDTPHQHGTWSEIFVVKEGDAILETNGTITGVTGTNSATHGAIFTDEQGKPRAQPQAAPAPQPAPEAAAAAGRRGGAPGDLAGTGIEGGTRQRVSAGDIILVPAGVPHRWLQVDKPVVYLDIKFPPSK